MVSRRKMITNAALVRNEQMRRMKTRRAKKSRAKAVSRGRQSCVNQWATKRMELAKARVELRDPGFFVCAAGQESSFCVEGWRERCCEREPEGAWWSLC